MQYASSFDYFWLILLFSKVGWLPRLHEMWHVRTKCAREHLVSTKRASGWCCLWRRMLSCAFIQRYCNTAGKNLLVTLDSVLVPALRVRRFATWRWVPCAFFRDFIQSFDYEWRKVWVLCITCYHSWNAVLFSLPLSNPIYLCRGKRLSHEWSSASATVSAVRFVSFSCFKPIYGWVYHY